MRKITLILSTTMCGIGVMTFVPRVHGQDGIDLLWRARALQAMDRIEKSAQRMKDRSQAITSKESCEMMLEFAYAQVIAKPDLVVKRSPGGVAYHLILNYGDDGLLDVLYSYDSETDECLGLSVDRLPKHRRLSIPHGNPDIVFVGNPADINEPPVVFSRSNPFRAFAGDPPRKQEGAPQPTGGSPGTSMSLGPKENKK